MQRNSVVIYVLQPLFRGLPVELHGQWPQVPLLLRVPGAASLQLVVWIGGLMAKELPIWVQVPNRQSKPPTEHLSNRPENTPLGQFEKPCVLLERTAFKDRSQLVSSFQREPRKELPVKPKRANMTVGQNPEPLLNIKMGGTWMFIHSKWSRGLGLRKKVRVAGCVKIGGAPKMVVLSLASLLKQGTGALRDLR